MSAAVNGTGVDFQVGAVKPLFQVNAVRGVGHPYNVTADGQRFLINALPAESGSAPITVVVNWGGRREEVKQVAKWQKAQRDSSFRSE